MEKWPRTQNTEHAEVKPDLENAAKILIENWNTFNPKTSENVVFSEALPTYEEQLQLAEELSEKEEAISMVPLEALCETYQLSPELLTKKEGYYELPVREHFMEDRLPEGYGYKGGAARTLLQKALGLPSGKPRDIDLVRFENGDSEKEAELAEKYMHNDYIHGDGPEYIDSQKLSSYFDTRDLTINEVLATDSTVLATEKCISDTLRGILRRTQFERRVTMAMPDKILAKLTRFYASALVKNTPVEVPMLETMTYWGGERYSLTPFWMALHLDRALEESSDTALQYVATLRQAKQIPDYIETARGLAEHLNNLMEDRPFYFRHLENAEDDHDQELVKWLQTHEEFTEYDDPEHKRRKTDLDRLHKEKPETR